MGSVDEDSKDATKLSEHFGSTDDLFSGGVQAEDDDIDEVCLQDARVFEVAFCLLLGEDDGSGALFLELLDFFATLTLLLCRLSLLCFLCGLFGIDVIKLEVVLFERGATSGTSLVEQLSKRMYWSERLKSVVSVGGCTGVERGREGPAVAT